MKFFKKVFLWGAIAGVLYFLLSYHIIFIGRSVKLLKKSGLTLENTFFSTQGKTNKQILAVDALREQGIADLLVEAGRMTEEEKEIRLKAYAN
jgi:hypothetical protein